MTANHREYVLFSGDGEASSLLGSIGNPTETVKKNMPSIEGVNPPKIEYTRSYVSVTRSIAYKVKSLIIVLKIYFIY